MIRKRKFVVLFHETPCDSARPNHWDLMLECDGYLETWSVPELPCAGKELQGQQLPRHRIDYLSYEGPVSKNRGKVERVLSGIYAGEIAPADSPHDFTLNFWLHEEHLTVRFLQLDETTWKIRF